MISNRKNKTENRENKANKEQKQRLLIYRLKYNHNQP